MPGQRPAITLSLSTNGATAAPWEEARRRLEQAELYFLGTVHPDGRPHMRPVLAVWADGALHFAAGPASRKARNVAHDTRCSITTDCEGAHLVLEGRATKVTDEGDRRSRPPLHRGHVRLQVQVACHGARRRLPRHRGSAHRRTTPVRGLPGDTGNSVRLRRRGLVHSHSLALLGGRRHDGGARRRGLEHWRTGASGDVLKVASDAVTSPIRASHGDEDLPPGVALFQIADGLGDLVQGVRPVDHRRDLAGLDELLEEPQVFLVRFHSEDHHLLAHER